MSSPGRDTLDRLRLVSTATLTTQLFKRGLRNAFMQGVRPLAQYGANLVGPAFTLRNIPAREDVDDVAGSQMDQREYQHGHAEQDRHGIEQAAKGKGPH